MGHAMVKCAKLFERKEQAGALLDIPYHMLYLTRHTIPYYTLCLPSRDAILGHKSVSVDRDTRTEARCDTGLCNTCDTVTHRGHLLPMLTSRQICRALGSRINKNLSSARIADQQDGYRDSPAMPALSKPRGIWMSNLRIILESSFIISNTLCLILVLVSKFCHCLIFSYGFWLLSVSCFFLKVCGHWGNAVKVRFIFLFNNMAHSLAGCPLTVEICIKTALVASVASARVT